jgi:hypothetical protein
MKYRNEQELPDGTPLAKKQHTALSWQESPKSAKLTRSIKTGEKYRAAALFALVGEREDNRL